MNSGYDTIIIDKQKADWVLRPTILSNLHNKVVILEKGVVIKAKKKCLPQKR
jgi:hypothetical protein